MNELSLIDPGVVTLIQNTFLDNVSSAFSMVSHYAFNLLYIFAAIELVILGIAWALQSNIGWDKLFYKVIKIGLIFFIIQNYPWLVNTILSSFAKLAGVVINDASVAQYIFNPAQIWQYGYDVGINLIQLATSSNQIGLVMVYLSIGMGILLVFGLLGIQMVVQTVSFYLVSFTSLIILPFGTLAPSKNMLDKAIQGVLKAGIRLMVLIIIIGIAVLVWNGFDFVDMQTSTEFNINQPLGLFFTGLLFLSLAFYLPNIASQVVGDISSSVLEAAPANVTVTSVGAGATTFAAQPIPSDTSNMQAATTIAPVSSSAGNLGSQESVSSAASAATVPTATTSSTLSGQSPSSQITKADLAKASSMSKTISENTVNKIKSAISKAMKEKQ